MAHNLEFNSERGTHSFFSRKELAWHRLGQVIEQAVTPEEALKLANLDYEVELFPLYASFIPDKGRAILDVSDNTYNMYDNKNNLIRHCSSKGVRINGNMGIVRTDNYKPLGVVGSRYTPVQNKESIDFIYNIFKNNPDIKEHDDIIIETAGALGQGERIFVTAKLPTGFKIGEEKDTNDLYVVFTNSHNGISSLTAMVTPVRVVCNNTLACALGDNKSKVSFRHTKNIQNAMVEGMTLLKLSYENFEVNKQLYNALLHIKVDQDLIDELLCKAMLNDNQLMQVSKFGMDNISTDIISTRTKNTIIQMRDYIDMGCGQETNRGTAYWAYMGINSFLNNGVSYKDEESKFDNLLGGTSKKTDSKVLNLFKELV